MTELEKMSKFADDGIFGSAPWRHTTSRDPESIPRNPAVSLTGFQLVAHLHVLAPLG